MSLLRQDSDLSRVTTALQHLSKRLVASADVLVLHAHASAWQEWKSLPPRHGAGRSPSMSWRIALRLLALASVFVALTKAAADPFALESVANGTSTDESTPSLVFDVCHGAAWRERRNE
jgi:hypothetical protein